MSYLGQYQYYTVMFLEIILMNRNSKYNIDCVPPATPVQKLHAVQLLKALRVGEGILIIITHSYHFIFSSKVTLF